MDLVSKSDHVAVMSTLGKLFGSSPFAPLSSHMQKVSDAIALLQKLFEENDLEKAEALAKQISACEFEADQIKNDIRNHLPKTIFLPVSRSSILEILTIQDTIADKAEDIAILFTLQPLKMYDEMKDKFSPFLEKTFDVFSHTRELTAELSNIVYWSGGGDEAKKVSDAVDAIAKEEHDVDSMQNAILKHLYKISNQMDHASFYLWTSLLKEISTISDLSEKLAHRIRTLVDT